MFAQPTDSMLAADPCRPVLFNVIQIIIIKLIIFSSQHTCIQIWCPLSEVVLVAWCSSDITMQSKIMALSGCLYLDSGFSISVVL